MFLSINLIVYTEYWLFFKQRLIVMWSVCDLKSPWRPSTWRTVQFEDKRGAVEPVAPWFDWDQTNLWCRSQSGSGTRRTWSLTPPAWQTVALPGGGLAAVGSDTIAPLQAAWPESAHLHVWTNANGQRIVRGNLLNAEPDPPDTKRRAARVLRHTRPGGFGSETPEDCYTSKNHTNVDSGWGKRWKVPLQSVQSKPPMICAVVLSQITAHMSPELTQNKYVVQFSYLLKFVLL